MTAQVIRTCWVLSAPIRTRWTNTSNARVSDRWSPCEPGSQHGRPWETRTVMATWVWAALAVRVLTAAPVDYGTRSCVDLATIRVQQAAGLANLAEWMDRHCSGELEFTNAFCRVQSRTMLERLDEAAEVESAWCAKRCRPDDR